MPSFDVVSEVDNHELTNAIDQAKKILATRYDFKGVMASYERQEERIVLLAEVDFQLGHMLEILKSRLVERKVDIKCLDIKAHVVSGKQVRQEVVVRQGLDRDQCRVIVAAIKNSKLKVQVAIQGEKIRVTGKKRDDLQEVITLLRKLEVDMPLQFDNFRD